MPSPNLPVGPEIPLLSPQSRLPDPNPNHTSTHITSIHTPYDHSAQPTRKTQPTQPSSVSALNATDLLPTTVANPQPPAVTTATTASTSHSHLRAKTALPKKREEHHPVNNASLTKNTQAVGPPRTGSIPSPHLTTIPPPHDQTTGNKSIRTNSYSHPPPPSSSSIHHRRKLEPLNIASSSTSSAASSSRSPNEESYTTHHQFSPSTPTFEGHLTGVTRRRLSNPTSPHAVRPRKKSIDSLRSLTSPDIHRRSISPKQHHLRTEGTSTAAWFPGNFLSLPPQAFKLNKSDDERENDDTANSVKIVTSGRSKKRRHWFGMASTPEHHHHTLHDAPLISMTPPSAVDDEYAAPPLPVPPSGLSPPRQQHPYNSSPHSSPFGLPSSSFISLPTDPNNILPLSLPASPFPSPPTSRQATPFHTPHPSLPDLAAEYTFSGSSAGPSGPSGSSGSPRTSISTSSSRIGWPVNGRSDSRSSADDEDSPVLGYSHHRGHSWWWRNGNQDVPVSPKIVVAPGPSSQSRNVRSRLIPTGTRSWGWLLEMVLDVCRVNTDERRSKGSSRSRRNRERERLMRGKTTIQVADSKWLGRVLAFVPTTPTSILAFLCFFAFLAFSITKTLMYILNPDKQALPWRQYCTSRQPTLYSLQDPYLRATDADSPFPLDSYSSSSTNLVLTPLTNQHASWPYHGHSNPPFSAESNSNLTALDPVGVLVGVFTTDAGVERRHMIRQSYASHWRSRTEGTEGVRVRFVMGRPRPKYAAAVQLEMEAFDDILLLDIPENMNSGKTHAFFSWAAANATVPYWEYPQIESPLLLENQKNMDSQAVEEALTNQPAPVWRGERPPQYVVKADDDSFIMLGELERRLRVAPRNKAYWGYLVKDLFMGGECYGLSFDLVQYIAQSPALRSLTRGKEDKLVSKWMRMHPEKESIVWVAEKCWIYDHPKAGTVYSHGFLYPSEVATIRRENATGISAATLALRGGPEAANAYSTVSQFGTAYRPIHNEMTATEQVESLVEGSPLSRLREDKKRSSKKNDQAYSHANDFAHKVSRMYATRPSRAQRFLDDPQERGGTVVVHYIKKTEWFVETMVALLGTADEQAVWHRGVGNGLGLLERRKGRVVPGREREETGVHVGKDGGL